ncbi:MAG TPA: PIN domain-containing protein [Acidimicrobiales bacterium]
MGLTVLDAGVLIGLLNRDDAYHLASVRALGDAFTRQDEIALPASALAEALVGPSRHGAAAVAVVRDLLREAPITIHPLDEDVAAVAAAFRAQHRSLRLPDALVIATAAALDADRLVTTDRKWPPRSKLGIRSEIRKL